MKTITVLFTLAVCTTLALYSQLMPKSMPNIPVWENFPFERFGDNYPTTSRSYSDIGNCILLEGPGNNNPGNINDYPNPVLPDSVFRYLQRQFKYIVLDQESFCDRYSQNSNVITAMFTTTYYTEAKRLMNGSNYVFVYFSPTLMDKNGLYPVQYRSGFDTSWYLHDVNNVRIHAGDDSSWVMDITNNAWRAFYISYVTDIITANNTAFGNPHVFIDIATTYPWATIDAGRIPAAKNSVWGSSYNSFFQSLRSAIPSGTKIIYNGPKLYKGSFAGDRYGMDYLANTDGLMLEGFGESAEESSKFDALMILMDSCRIYNKIFLGIVHYGRSDSLLSTKFSLPYLGPDGKFPAPLATYYRIQMSYLAYFLLHQNDNANFGFQPGWTYNQFNTYYKPWDERIGTPIADYSTNTVGHYYYRPFTNAEVYVNYSNTQQAQIMIPSGYYYYSYNGVTYHNNKTDYPILSDSSIALNSLEGVVIFKKIQVDQKLQGGASVDSIGHWYKNKFILHKAPANIPIALNTVEVIKASQKVISSEKYIRWENDNDIKNHHNINLPSFVGTIRSNLNPTLNATIQTTIDGFSVTAPSAIEFKDPWLIDYADSYGNRNRGTEAVFHTIGTPYNANNSIYNGVFLGQDPQTTQNYFSIQAQLTNSNIGGFAGYFQNWSSSSASLQQVGSTSGYDQKAVVFGSNNATVTANYKGSFISGSTTAISNSGQRKVVRTTNPTTLHFTYESMGYVWYETSTDNGATWQLMNNNQPLGIGKLPSITSVDRPSYETDAVLIAYQPGSVIKVKCFSKPPSSNTFSYQCEATDISSNPPPSTDANPTITQTIVSGGNLRIFLVWEGYTQVGLNWEKTLRYWSADCFYTSFGTGTNGVITDATVSSSNPSIDAFPGGGDFQLAWQEGTSSIMYKSIQSNFNQTSAVNVSSGDGYSNNYNPSIIAVNSVAYPARLSWVAKRYEESGGEEFSKSTAGDGEWKFRTIFTSPTEPGAFWAFGDAVNSTNTNINVAGNGYIVAWSKSDGVNQYTRGSTLGGTIVDFKISGNVINGKDVQVVPGSSYNDMYGIMLNTQTPPYQFKRSDNIGALGKEQSTTEIFSGREGVVSNGNAQFYFTLGDVTVNGKIIEFEEIPDSLVVDNKTLMNHYLETKPFELNNQSDFTYGVVYGITDSVECAKLVEKGSISYKVQLVNTQSGNVIGEFDNISYGGSNIFQYKNIGYQVKTNGIGTVTVILRLVVSSTVDVRYRLGNKFSTESITSLGKSNSNKKLIGYQGSLVPKSNGLLQNYPNPFNPTTSISYSLSEAGNVMLKVYDVLGKEVASLVSAYQESGRYSVGFDASKLSSGIYIYKLTSKNFSEIKKMMLVK